MKEITSKIIGFRVQSEAREAIPVPPCLPDVDPESCRIERRPDGALEAVAEKIDYHTSEGRKRLYLIVSFTQVTGIRQGHPVSVERPIEFFIPSGQLSSEHQWITATMRSLSLAARGGYITKALQDLRKVAWDKGPVRLGTNAYGKPVYHDSEVAAIAWAIQRIIDSRRNDKHEDNSPSDLTDAPTVEGVEVVEPRPVPPAPTAEFALSEAGLARVVGTCPECGGDQILKDGCPSCLDCGHSKCG